MHPLQAISEQGMQQVAKDVAARSGLVTKAAGTLFGAFAKTADNHRTRVIYDLVTQGFTHAEFEAIERRCAELAIEADKANGWQPPQDAKGRAKYGPKQSTMASRASDRRAVFGVLKLHMAAIVPVGPANTINPDTLPVWEFAVNKARQYLASVDLDWTGTGKKALTGRRQAQLEHKAVLAADEEVKQANPQKPGESIAQWYARIAPMVEERKAELAEDTRKEQADKVAAKLIEEYGLALCLQIADAITRAASGPAPVGDPINPQPAAAPVVPEQEKATA